MSAPSGRSPWTEGAVNPLPCPRLGAPAATCPPANHTGCGRSRGSLRKEAVSGSRAALPSWTRMQPG